MPILILAVIVFAIAGAIAMMILGSIILRSLPLYIKASSSGVHLPFFKIFGMRLRGLDPQHIVLNYIRIFKAGVEIDLDSLEAHVMAHGNLDAVCDAIISAHNASIDIDFDRVAAIDLAGRDVLDAVQACVNTVMITVPPLHAAPATGVSRNGVRLSARVRVTVRANFERLVGGAGVQTIAARVGEGICSAIGQTDTHMEIIENPPLISQYILNHGLDAGTAYEIVSVDVADIDIVDNVGARLAEEQAEADKQVAQARSEMRRAAAFATEKENVAIVVGHSAAVTAARANIPTALAEAARAGRMWRSPRPLLAAPRHRLWDIRES